MPADEYDVFISYASPDRSIAESIHKQLVSAGFKVWFDKARLEPGCDWHQEIERGCESSRIMLPVMTPHWKLSEWTKYETYGAESVIPLIAEGAPEETFTPPLLRFQGHDSVDLSDQMGNVGWDRLQKVIRKKLSQPKPEKRTRLSDVRFQPNPYFVGREKVLNKIHEVLHQAPSPALKQGRISVVAANGGYGKTTLARQYVEKFWRCYPQIFWVDCRLGIENEYARICDLLFPQYRNEHDVPAKASIVLQAIHSTDDRLLVLDNVENEKAIQDWLPRSGHSHTLITSRFTAWSAANFKITHLYLLDPSPAHQLLATRAGYESYDSLEEDEKVGCADLAKRLDYLPLALEQAAAYIFQQGINFTFAAYVRLFDASTADLLNEHTMGSTEYPASVYATWKSTIEKLSPAARAVLRLCSFLSSASLPLSAMINGIDHLREESESLSGESLDVGNVEIFVRDCIKELRAYSMVNADGNSISFHPLVQAVQRLQLEETIRVSLLKRCLEWMNELFKYDPNEESLWPLLDPLLPHCRAVGEHADGATISLPTAPLLLKVGGLLHVHARHQEAEPCLRRAYEIVRALLGENPDVSQYANALAVVLNALNRKVESLKLQKQALKLKELKVGENSPELTRYLRNLSELQWDLGHVQDAEKTNIRAIQIDQANKARNPNPDLATDLNLYAQLLSQTNRIAQAKPLMERAFQINKQVYGDEHRSIADTLNNFGLLLLGLPDDELQNAEEYLAESLRIKRKLFGETNPTVATTLNNLGLLYQRTKRPDEAESAFNKALDIYNQSLFPGHVSIAQAQMNLSMLLKSKGDLEKAETLCRQAFEGYKRAHGEKAHPSFALAFNNLAQILQQRTNPAKCSEESLLTDPVEIEQALSESEECLRQAIAITTAVFDEDHINVAISQANLAHQLMHHGRLDEASPLMRRHFEIYLNATATNRQVVKDLFKASKYYTDLLKARGLNDDQIRDELTELAAGAEKSLRDVLTENTNENGDIHPRTAAALRNLAELLMATHRLDDAEPLMKQQCEIYFRLTRANAELGEQPMQVSHDMRVAVKHYGGLLLTKGLSQAEAETTIKDFALQFGLNLSAG